MIEGTVAVVTGAGRGVGREIAITVAGASVRSEISILRRQNYNALLELARFGQMTAPEALCPAVTSR